MLGRENEWNNAWVDRWRERGGGWRDRRMNWLVGVYINVSTSGELCIDEWREG